MEDIARVINQKPYIGLVPLKVKRKEAQKKKENRLFLKDPKVTKGW